MQLQKNVEMPQKPGPRLFAVLLIVAAILSVVGTVLQAMYVDRGLPATPSAASTKVRVLDHSDR